MLCAGSSRAEASTSAAAGAPRSGSRFEELKSKERQRTRAKTAVFTDVVSISLPFPFKLRSEREMIMIDVRNPERSKSSDFDYLAVQCFACKFGGRHLNFLLGLYVRGLLQDQSSFSCTSPGKSRLISQKHHILAAAILGSGCTLSMLSSHPKHAHLNGSIL